MQKYKQKELKVEPLVGGDITDFDLKQRMRKRFDVLGVTDQKFMDTMNGETLFTIGYAKEWCQSPIEIKALQALMVAPWHGFFTCPISVHSPKNEKEFPSGDLVIIPQFGIARYRIDFAIIASTEKNRIIISVECDGDEFHNTKGEDFRNDKARDAYLENFGIKTFRLAGCDLYANPFQSIIPVTNFLSDWKAINE